MEKNASIQSLFVVIWLSITTVGLTQGFCSENNSSVTFHGYSVHPVFKTQLDSIYKAVHIENWPKTDVLRVAPKVDESILLHPERLNRGGRSCGSGPFSDKTWFGGVGVWGWDRLVKNTEPLPTELPPERKKHLLERMSPEKRSDPNFVKEYLQRKLERYRKSKMHSVTGSIDLRVCVAPNSEVANAYLIERWQGCSLPTESIVSSFSESNRIKDIGTIGFIVGASDKYAHIQFVRDNIAIVIDARGELAVEGLPLAKKIDSLILQQPVSTYEQLLARRPSITIAAKAVKSTTTDRFTVSYDVSTPEGQEIADVKAYVNGESTWFEDGKIVILVKKGKVKVKLIAITRELLANTFERELIINE